MENKPLNKQNSKIDWLITIVPLALVLVLCLLFFLIPDASQNAITQINTFLGTKMGGFYIVLGLGIFIIALALSFSPIGKIVLGGQEEKPKYSFFAWGSMMFTAGLAADILFYSFSEWILYATDRHVAQLGDVEKWSGIYPLFHWSLIPWAFYLVLAVAFGFMLHVRNRDRQKYSEACRPILGKHTDGILGRCIDLLATFALLAGTATTFGLATPLMANIITDFFGLSISPVIVNIAILIATCVVYTYALLHGIKGIGILAKACVWLFFGLLAYVLLLTGQTRYIIETGLTSLWGMVKSFLPLSLAKTATGLFSATNETEAAFSQGYTIFYWAYWMTWCVAAPFFIGSISRGRTVRQTLLGGFAFGVGSTILSFVILGNYSMGMQFSGAADFVAQYTADGNLYGAIIAMMKSMPGGAIVMVVVLVTMMLFYATSFDSIAMIGACYSYKKLGENEKPHKMIQFMWCILLILLPIALLFSESSMGNLQAVAIIAAFPIGFVIILITASFIKDACKFLKEQKALKKAQEETPAE